MHAKPCFYCIVLLTTLFVSSCYWQPFPMDSPLSTPWAQNITTFAEALNNTLNPNYTKPLPDVIQAVDRCWCDFSAGGFFEPFNVTHWEHVSVQRLKDDLERQQKVEDAALKQEDAATAATPTVDGYQDVAAMTQTPAPKSSLKSASRDLRSIVRLFQYALKGDSGLVPSSPEYTPLLITTSPDSIPSARALPHPKTNGAFIRREYDLRPYGLGILVDFGWTR
ncbi:hypothetical protein H0H87_010212 [Tephrocybe sp. NHM501043]|nr:hypothetical protein H0H87_010212 [Tephrocybe sp. NHM501043]